MGYWWSSSNSGDVVRKMIPYLCMIFVQFSCSSYSIVSKIIFTQGTNPFVFNFYQFIVAAFFMAPLAFFFERKTRPPLTLSITCWIFLLALLGVTIFQNLFSTSLNYISSTSQSAIGNLFPALTYILSIVSRQEEAELNTIRGVGKLSGTLISLLGTFALIFWRTDFIRLNAMSPVNLPIGYVFATLGVVSLSIWLVLQCRVMKFYPAELSLTAIIYFFGAIQTYVVAAAMTSHKASSEWVLNSYLELLNILIGGVVICGIGTFVVAWCAQKKGPAFVAIFTPLSLLLTAITEMMILGSTMDVGCVVGSVTIVGGLYLFLWSKSKEKSDESKDANDDDAHQGFNSSLLLNQNP